MTDELEDARDALARAVRDFARATDPNAVLDGFIVVYDLMEPEAESADGIAYGTAYTTSDGSKPSQLIGMLAYAKRLIFGGDE